MPRNGAGVYTLPAGNPVVPLTVITTSWANPTLTDLGNEITGSLSRNGFGGMLAPFRLFDGTQALPGLAFSNEPGIGWYREGAGLSHLVTANTKAFTIKASRGVFPADSEYRGVNAYKVAGQKSWDFQNIAGVMNLVPSATIDAEDWSFAKATTWDPATGIPTFPVVAGAGYVRITGDTMTGSLTINRTVAGAATALVSANLSANAAADVNNILSVGTQVISWYARIQTHATPEWGLSGTGNVPFKLSTNSLVRVTVNGTGEVGIGGTASVGAFLDVIGGAFRVQGSSVPAAGAGLEVSYAANTATLLSFDRTGGVYRLFASDGAQHTWLTSGVLRMTLTAAGLLGVGQVPNAGLGFIQIPASNVDVTSSAYFGGIHIVSNATVGYPAIGYNIVSGNAANTWRFSGADNCSWIQFRGNAIFMFTSTNAPAAGGIITPLLGWSITSDGRVFGTALHNNAGAVTGTTSQYVASGTYTPVLTNVLNIAASTAFLCQWIRVGNVVTVSGKVDIDTTAGGVLAQLGMSLPIASNFATAQNLGGTFVHYGNEGRGGGILADVANDRADFQGLWTNAANLSFAFSFTYTVL